MIIRDEHNKVTGIVVKWHGADVTITKDTFAGGKRDVPLDVLLKTLEPARHDRDVWEFVNEIVQNIRGRA